MSPPLDLGRYGHVIWDWNGTLLDDAALARGVVNGMLARRGLPTLSPERYGALFDFPIERYYRRLGFDLQAEPFAELAREFHAQYGPRWRDCSLHRGAEAALSAVEAAGVEQSLLSASLQSTLLEHVAHFELTDRFQGLVGVETDHGTSKAAAGRSWLDALGQPPSRVLMIGDTCHDHEVAAELGADCVLVAAGHQARRRLEGCGVPVYDGLGEFFEPG